LTASLLGVYNNAISPIWVKISTSRERVESARWGDGRVIKWCL